jgi:hypothetical protein
MSDSFTLKADFAGAIRKTATLMQVPAAHKLQATYWSSETVKELMASADRMQKSPKKTSLMKRNIGQKIIGNNSAWSITIGTGVGGKQTVPYARIQDQGGTTAAHDIFPRKGKALAFMRGGEMTFLRHVHHPGSKIPASGWFSNVIDKREPILRERMQPDVVLKLAEVMAGSSAGKLAKAPKWDFFNL